jgi:hypothetical protein
MTWGAVGVMTLAIAAWAQTQPTKPVETKPAAPAKQKHSIRHRFATGRWIVTQSLKSESLTSVDGTPLPAQRVDQVIEMAFDVQAGDAKGERTVAIAFRRIRQTVEVGKRKMAFDSAAAEGEQDRMLAAVFAPMMQATIALRVDKDGKALEVKGLSSMWDNVIRDNPALAPLLGKMKTTLGDAMVRNVVSQAAGFLPDGPVAVGEAWRAAWRVPIPFVGEVKGEYDCLLQDVQTSGEGRLAIIRFEGKLKSDRQTPATSIGSATVSVHLMDLDQKGELAVSMDLGTVVRQSVQQAGKVQMVVSDQFGLERKVDVRQTSDIRLRVRAAGEAGAAASRAAP